MYFQKGTETVEVKLNTGIMTFIDGTKLKVSGLKEAGTTMKKIAFMEDKGYRVPVHLN